MHGKGSRDLSACQHCGLCPLLVNGEVGPYKDVDPCLGILPDVTQACCGHGGHVTYNDLRGKKERMMLAAYVVISPGDPPGTFASEARGPWRVLRGQDALDYFAAQGVGPEAALRRVSAA